MLTWFHRLLRVGMKRLWRTSDPIWASRPSVLNRFTAWARTYCGERMLLSTTVPAKTADAFAARFMMLGEIRDRLGGYFGNLRRQLEMAGFEPDPSLEKCLCAGYLRSTIEPFVRRIETGEVSLGKPEPVWKTLVREAQKILTTAKAPLPSEDLLTKLRCKMSIGPSDQDDFFYSTMWDLRETFVFIEGAGWWLRALPYLGRTFPLDRPAPTQTEIVDETVIGLPL